MKSKSKNHKRTARPIERSVMEKRSAVKIDLYPDADDPIVVSAAGLPAPTMEPPLPSSASGRTDSKSWLLMLFTGFGALVVRYLRIVRERGRRGQKTAC